MRITEKLRLLSIFLTVVLLTAIGFASIKRKQKHYWEPVYNGKFFDYEINIIKYKDKV